MPSPPSRKPTAMSTSTSLPQPDRMIAVSTGEIAELTNMGATIVHLSERPGSQSVTLWAGGANAEVACENESYHFGNDPSWNSFRVDGRSEGNRWGAVEKIADITIEALAARSTPADATLVISETDIRSFVRMGANLLRMGERPPYRVGLWAGANDTAWIACADTDPAIPSTIARLTVNDGPPVDRWEALHIYNSIALDALCAPAQAPRLAMAA